MASTPPLLLKPEEAARILAVGRTRIFELIRAGALPSVVIDGSRSRRIRAVDLEHYVARLGSQDQPEAA